MEGAVRAAGRAGIPYINQGSFELKRAVLVACQLPSLAAPWSPHYPRDIVRPGLAGLVS
jgi:hypothetical protein